MRIDAANARSNFTRIFCCTRMFYGRFTGS
jgi:hypothetical protein